MDIKEQTLELIKKLKTSEESKTALAAELDSNGVTAKLITKISEVIDQSEKDLLERAEADMDNFKTELAAAKELLIKLKQEQSSANQASEAKALEEIRKQIQS